jgi:hypothetical protein
MRKIDSFPSLVNHLEESGGSYAKSSLEAYLYKNAYTGSCFETFRSDDNNNYTAQDIVAVSMLSVNIPPSASRWILGAGKQRLNELLKGIDETLSIDNTAADLAKGSTAWKLWNEIHSLSGIGETKASKLLAVKRPSLFPIYDQHVAKALKLSPHVYWEPWQSFMQSEDGKKATKIVTQLADSLGKGDLSPLRLLDIVIWMQQHGHKFITQELVDRGVMIPVNYADPT